MIRRYFEDELRYLQDEGRTFAKRHPELARQLNVESLADRDPYVERLFEGFAFLTGRIRERLEDDFPEYTESLFRLLHPHFVKPIPSMAIVELKPRPGILQQTTLLERGTEVRSEPVGEEKTTCRFTTAFDVSLQPITLKSAALKWPDTRSSVATLRFALDRGVELSSLDLNKLRLFFFAEPSVASTMRWFFSSNVRRVTYRAGGSTVELSGTEAIGNVGFAQDEGLLPFGKYSFAGYRLLLEYFSYRPKFWFADLLQLGRLTPEAGLTEFEVEVHFDRPYPEDRKFSTENILLHCTPVTNLYDAAAEPVVVNHKASEYRLIGDIHSPDSVRIYDVQSVTGRVQATDERHTYHPYFGFEHHGAEARHFTETARVGSSGNRDVYVALGGLGEAVSELEPETLSVEVRCTNGDLPRQELKEGAINQFAPGVPNVATVRNITRPSVERQSPVEKRDSFLWQLVSHLALNKTCTATPEALASLLRLYDWVDSDANRLRLDGLRNVSWNSAEQMFRGGVIRGAEVTVEVQDGHFPDDGDLHLWGSVLSEFYSMYSTINSFVHLKLVTTPSGKEFVWRPERGVQPVF